MMNISTTLYNQLIDHGFNQLPYEACGLLGGIRQDEVLSVWPLKNEWKSRVRYYVSEEVIEDTLKQVEAKGQKVLAIYHSHPVTAPIPSSTDIRHHPDPKVKMVILSYKLDTPEVKCFNIYKKSYEEHPFFIKTL